MGKIREYNKEFPLEESVKAAIQYCIEKDILRQFLKEHSSEVINMLTEDITVEELAAVRYEEGREDERKNVMELLSQGFSVEELKQLLTQT